MIFEGEVFGFPYRNVVRIRGNVCHILSIRRKSQAEIVIIWEVIVNSLNRLISFFNIENHDS